MYSKITAGQRAPQKPTAEQLEAQLQQKATQIQSLSNQLQQYEEKIKKISELSGGKSPVVKTLKQDLTVQQQTLAMLKADHQALRLAKHMDSQEQLRGTLPGHYAAVEEQYEKTTGVWTNRDLIRARDRGRARARPNPFNLIFEPICLAS